MVCAHAAVAAALAQCEPVAGGGSHFYCAASSAGPFMLSCLARAVKRDVVAARRLEQAQEHPVWLNPHLLRCPGGVDLVALANVVRTRDLALLKRHATFEALQASFGDGDA